MVLPQTFEEWKYCIEIKCNIKLTNNYIQQRIEALTNPTDNNSNEFVKLYGESYKEQVLQWFHQVLQLNNHN